ncbi:MAG: lipid-A-disaccharide synthase [Candidatus Omnitrophota bacterium]
MEKKILVVAGEASGDIHAANLVLQLKNIYPDALFYGLGGKNMKAAGVDISCDLTALAVVGFSEILKNYSKFKKIFLDLLEKTKEIRPDAAILVDYPGFNLRLAGALKKMGIKVAYFISPQVWAWGSQRTQFIKKNVDLMLVLFKFEEILYRDNIFNVKFVGHPLLDIVKPTMDRGQLSDAIGMKKSGRIIAILPGSREREVTNHLPVMLEAAQEIYKKIADAQFLICRTTTVKRETFKQIIDRTKIDFPYKVIDDTTYAGIHASDFVLVASGTATLETAILNKPMVIIYKVSFLSWLLAKMFIKIPHIGLVNVVAGQKIVPELVQFDATPKKIAKVAISLLEDKEELRKVHAELYALKNTLGIPGASRRAAEEIAKLLG